MIVKPRWSVQLRAIMRKEVSQTVRDRRIMFMLIVAPSAADCGLRLCRRLPVRPCAHAGGGP
jgi:hypothetical protein